MGYRKQLPIRTEQLKVMGAYSFKKRASKIDEEFKQSLQHRMSQAQTAKEKRELVKKSNPLFYMFGDKCKVFKPYLTYEENYVEIN